MTALLEELTVGATDPCWLQAGVTPRMLEYWTVNGYLHVAEDSDVRPGSGRVRRWQADEVSVAARLVRLRAVGLPLDLSAEIARQGFGVYEIGRGVKLVIAP
jgi:hypothetical protein